MGEVEEVSWGGGAVGSVQRHGGRSASGGVGEVVHRVVGFTANG